MTAKNPAQQSFFQRPMVILGLLLSLPLILTLAGIMIVTTSGPPPGGTTATCERYLDDDIGFRITLYTFTSGLTRYDQQTFASTRDSGTTWEDIFEGLVIAPLGTTCDENIQFVTDEAIVLWNRNNVAVTQDAAETWSVQNICDLLPTTLEDCDPEMLDFVSVSFEDAKNGLVEVREFAIDDFGERLTSDGNPITNIRYDLRTVDGGITWEIE